ncbi:MAG: transcriptional repressor [Synechococcaceae cyanobacterium]|nr:transcriptional repressor [Synechococcaceae cyanobacterium]
MPATRTVNLRQRALLEQLRLAGRELSGQELHGQLRREGIPMGLATVYRHLKQLQQSGEVRCRHLSSGEALYAPRDRDEHHLNCIDCGLSVPLPHCPMAPLHLSEELMQGFRPLFHTLEFFGVCARCQARRGAGPREGAEGGPGESAGGLTDGEAQPADWTASADCCRPEGRVGGAAG